MTKVNITRGQQQQNRQQQQQHQNILQVKNVFAVLTNTIDSLLSVISYIWQGTLKIQLYHMLSFLKCL